MGELGLHTQRISISWPRIIPDGDGKFNQKGLDFYRRVVDSMLENGVAPFIMLYHWDLPQKLQERGGWLNRDTSDRLAELAERVFAAFPKEVPYWGTILEPQIISITVLGWKTCTRYPRFLICLAGCSQPTVGSRQDGQSLPRLWFIRPDRNNQLSAASLCHIGRSRGR